MENVVKPLEEVDPFLAEEFRQIANGIHPIVKSVEGFNLVLKQKNIISNKIGRNDPCFCGSGKKYKKCHGNE